MALRRWFILGMWGFFWFSGMGTSLAAESKNVAGIQFENDFFGGGTDRHFTHGTRIEIFTRPIKWIENAADKLPWFEAERARARPDKALRGGASLSLGQNIYTPEDTGASRLIRDDRPYAGWLYMGVGLVANQGESRYDKLELEIGVVGPCSLAEDVQTFWHSLFDLDQSEGWEHGLNNELGIVLYYEQARRLHERRLTPGMKLDVIPHFGGALGNVFSYAAGGLILRVGSNLEQDFGPPRIRPSLPGSSYYRPRTGFGWYVFAGVEGRAVLRDIFLDGNTFSDSHSVDKESLVGDLQAGIVLQWGRFRFSYTQIVRSEEFETQERPDVFGSLNLSCHF